MATTAISTSPGATSTDGARGAGRRRCREESRMSLILHYHPLVLLLLEGADRALRERDAVRAEAGRSRRSAESRAAFAALWPMAKMPVLEDEARGEVVPETSDHHRLSGPPLSGAGPVRARGSGRGARGPALGPDLRSSTSRRRCRGSSATGSGRPGRGDPLGVAEARDAAGDRRSAWSSARSPAGHWATGEDFTLADCAAAPALFYADKVMPLDGAYPNALALLERLKARPSFARVLAEAEPYFQYFPAE